MAARKNTKKSGMHKPKSGGKEDPNGTPRKKRLTQSTVPKKPKKGY